MDDGRAIFRGQMSYPQSQATGKAQQMYMAPGLQYPTVDHNMPILPQLNPLLNASFESHHRGTIAAPSQPIVDARSSSCSALAAAQGVSSLEDASLLDELLVSCGDEMVRACIEMSEENAIERQHQGSEKPSAY